MVGGAGNDSLNSLDGVVNNDSLDGGTGNDICDSDPDPELNCELSKKKTKMQKKLLK
jgi:hypothetical protein